MEPAGWITLALVGVAAVLLVTERLRPDLTALLILIVLSLTGIVTPEQAFAGFSQSAVITILAIFILTFALEQTGVTHWVGMRLLRGLGASEARLATALMLTAAALSLVMNSIAAAAVPQPRFPPALRAVRFPSDWVAHHRRRGHRDGAARSAPASLARYSRRGGAHAPSADRAGPGLPPGRRPDGADRAGRLGPGRPDSAPRGVGSAPRPDGARHRPSRSCGLGAQRRHDHP